MHSVQGEMELLLIFLLFALIISSGGDFPGGGITEVVRHGRVLTAELGQSAVEFAGCRAVCVS